MNKLILHIAFLFSITITIGQSTDEQLANYYFNEGDCEKAISYFEKVYDVNPSEFIFTRYLSCLKESNQDKETIQLIEKQITSHPYNIEYKVALGNEYEQQNNQKKAAKTFLDLIENITPNPRGIIDLQKAFSKLGKNELALQTLIKGNQVLNGNYPLNIQFAEVYAALNQDEMMIKEYINLLDYNPKMISSLKILIPRMIDFEEED